MHLLHVFDEDRLYVGTVGLPDKSGPGELLELAKKVFGEEFHNASIDGLSPDPYMPSKACDKCGGIAGKWNWDSVERLETFECNCGHVQTRKLVRSATKKQNG